MTLTQIRQNFRSKSTGWLSACAVISQIAECLARLSTTVTEVGDSLVSAGFGLALLLHIVFGVQLWIYWGKGEDLNLGDEYKLEEKANTHHAFQWWKPIETLNPMPAASIPHHHHRNQHPLSDENGLGMVD